MSIEKRLSEITARLKAAPAYNHTKFFRDELTFTTAALREAIEALEKAEDAANMAHARLVPHVNDQHCDQVIQIASDIGEAIESIQHLAGESGDE